MKSIRITMRNVFVLFGASIIPDEPEAIPKPAIDLDAKAEVGLS